MFHLKQVVQAGALTLCAGISASVWADSYQIDPGHSFVQFSIGHLGVSTTVGRFNRFEGQFELDQTNAADSRVELTVDTASIDTNHQKRDDHLRSPDFFDVKQFPQMRFKSTSLSGSLESGTLTGELTLHGVTRPVSFTFNKVGEGKDPWGGYRAGFTAHSSIKRSDFGVSYFIPGVSDQTDVSIFIEGIRQ